MDTSIVGLDNLIMNKLISKDCYFPWRSKTLFIVLTLNMHQAGVVELMLKDGHVFFSGSFSIMYFSSLFYLDLLTI